MQFKVGIFCKIIAFDTIDYSFLNSDEQYNIRNINHEINKCISAFQNWFGHENYKITTGSLDCNKFKGDRYIKVYKTI